MKCSLCKETLDTEHPLSIRDRNPETFRIAWMHYWCYTNALEELKNVKPSKAIYLNRQDEYYTHFR